MVKKLHHEYTQTVQYKSSKDATKQFEYRSKLRDLNHMLDVHDQLVQKQRELEAQLVQTESHPPRLLLDRTHRGNKGQRIITVVAVFGMCSHVFTSI